MISIGNKIERIIHFLRRNICTVRFFFSSIQNWREYCFSRKKEKKFLSEVGFEPTPTFVDQNAHFIEAKSIALESGALDRSAILTLHQ